MKSKKNELPLALYKRVTEVMSKAYDASQKVLEENKRLGIPSPFSFDGRIYHLMPDGRIVMKHSKRKTRS